jgi:hypothetical protein
MKGLRVLASQRAPTRSPSHGLKVLAPVGGSSSEIVARTERLQCPFETPKETEARLPKATLTSSSQVDGLKTPLA